MRDWSCRRWSGGHGRRRYARTCASTTSTPGSPHSWPISAEFPRSRANVRRMTDLSHVDEAGDVRMVDVGGKPLSRRRAVAAATVRMAPETANRLRELPKGDALATAQVAGIMAAKRTAELIPLCHPLPLTNVDLTVDVQIGRAHV